MRFCYRVKITIRWMHRSTGPLIRKMLQDNHLKWIVVSFFFLLSSFATYAFFFHFVLKIHGIDRTQTEKNASQTWDIKSKEDGRFFRLLLGSPSGICISWLSKVTKWTRYVDIFVICTIYSQFSGNHRIRHSLVVHIEFSVMTTCSCSYIKNHAAMATGPTERVFHLN